ncbi:MAG: hypothetical protein LLG04_18420, partial [Parachlamydia sp.]|nr:hypothetical protein [Parachlamydia sp.]
IAQMMLQWTPEELTAHVVHLSPPQLEAAGRNLTLAQIYALLDYAAEGDPQFHWKLSPLLVGMPHGLFAQLLLAASPHQLEVLKLEAVTEPVQHQLTLVTHEVTHQLPQVVDRLDQVSVDISLLPIGSQVKDPVLLKRQLKELATWHESTIQMISKVLALAWNSNRPDLIDKLSHAKEWCQKLIATIGKPKTPFGEAQGLYARLDENLEAVYGSPSLPSSIEAADDDEPAIEGLTKLSFWYLMDYYQIGLLPEISDPALLDLDPATHSEQERLHHREQLMEAVRNNLTKMGLSSVKDLKQAGIYSREALQAYIEQHQLR